MECRPQWKPRLPIPLLAVVLVAGMAQTAPSIVDYVVGPQDVLTITSYDQADLSGKFTIEADGTFTFPLIGRFKAGGLTLSQVEEGLKKRLKDEGYFRNPQVTVAVETYKSHRVFVVGEVRTPGTYPLSGNMNLVEALARAGSTLPTASSEAVIVHAGDSSTGPTLPTSQDGDNIVRVDLHKLQEGVFSENTILRDGDTIFVPRAESVYVFGQVKNAGAYVLQHGSRIDEPGPDHSSDRRREEGDRRQADRRRETRRYDCRQGEVLLIAAAKDVLP